LFISILYFWHGRWLILIVQQPKRIKQVQTLNFRIMKKLITLVFGILAFSFSSKATSENTQNYYPSNNSSSYIFVENNIEFSIFPDGQFDFVYVGGHNGTEVSVSVGSPNVNISFNAGHDYDMYVQYDDYGAVIQIEDIPIYYDAYGRITQAGSVDIRYNNRRIVRVGGLYLHYNNYGYYSHSSGFINPWNRYYVYRPWHVYYARPFYSHCVVYDYAYRTHYTPYRYSYNHHYSYYRNRGHNNSYTNGRRSFYRPGSRVHHRNGRTAVNKEYKPSRRNKAAALNSRKGSPVTNSSLRGNPRKGKPVTTTQRDGVYKGRPVTSNKGDVKRGKPVTSNRKEVKNDYRKNTKSNNSVRRSNTSVNKSKGRPVVQSNNKRSSVSKSRGNTVKRSTTSRSGSQKRTVTKRTSQTKPKQTVRNSSSRSKGKVSKRSRG